MIKYIPDMHIHSKFSFDSIEPMEVYIDKCINLGISSVAFTDHIDFDFPGYENSFYFNYDEYSKKIERLRGKYKNINIIKGLEIGVTNKSIKESIEFIENNSFDYIILSAHIIKNSDPYDKKIYENYKKNTLYNTYLNLLLEILKQDITFNTLGHYDYITRYAPYSDPTIYYKDHSSLFDEIFEILISKNKYFELNTQIFNKQKYPKNLVFDKNIFKRYKELGGEKIVIGSDSHKADQICLHFNKAYTLLRNIGFSNKNILNTNI